MRARYRSPMPAGTQLTCRSESLPSSLPAPSRNTTTRSTAIEAAAHQLSFRFLLNHQSYPLAAPLPTANFNQPTIFDNYKAAAVDTWSLSNSLVNDLRLSYSHSLGSEATPTAYADFPIDLAGRHGRTAVRRERSSDDNLQDTYQVFDMQTKLVGRHTLKYGVEWRHYICAGFFLSRSTGNYFYSSTDLFIHDLAPDQQGLRGSGEPIFLSTQSAFYTFLQDDFKVNNRLTLNLGLRYEFTNNPLSASTQEQNAVANVPGVIEFKNPGTAKLDFEPRIGFAWDPTGQRQNAVRGGFGIGYSPAPNNFDELAFPPQLQTEFTFGSVCLGLAIRLPGVTPARTSSRPAHSRPRTPWRPEQRTPARSPGLYPRYESTHAL